jgi:hypothetical protein
VLFEINGDHADVKAIGTFEQVVHAMNNGRGKKGEGTEITTENFLAFARISITGVGQNYISRHIASGALKRARVVDYPVPEPEDKKGRKQSVPAYYD